MRIYKDEKLRQSEYEHWENDEIALVTNFINEKAEWGAEYGGNDVGDHDSFPRSNLSKAESFYKKSIDIVQEGNIETDGEHTEHDD